MDLNAHANLINQIFRYLSVDLFKRAIPRDAFVLDIGAGDGAVAFPLAEDGRRVMCLDTAEERLANIESTKGDLSVETRRGDVNDIPFPDNTFDAVVSRMVLPVQPDWRVTLRENLRVCKPGGVIVHHHNSRENLDFCRQRAVSDAHLRYVEKALTRKGRTSNEELRNFCRETGATQERVVPLSFFMTSSLIYRTGMLPDEVAAYEAELQRRLESKPVYEFVNWFEREVVSRLPQDIAGMMVVILKKPDIESSGLD